MISLEKEGGFELLVDIIWDSLDPEVVELAIWVILRAVAVQQQWHREKGTWLKVSINFLFLI